MSAPTLVPDAPTAPPLPFAFDPVDAAVAAIRAGEFVVVMDDESRENEGDLICAAEKITEEGMAWFVRWTSGYICLPLPLARLDALGLPSLTPPPSSPFPVDAKGTAYHLTFDASPALHPVTTGISAHDRAYAARLVASGAGADQFTRPGHIVSLRYTSGGTRVRRGHTESAVDLCYLAGLAPAGLLCELVDPHDPKGSMAKRDASWAFARRWGLKIIGVDDLARYVHEHGDGLVPKAGE
ncbi:3,4-dihydroxy 2-butanone 4-phosphate synthase [Cryptotrichosporon argae]